jgi:hypothetical protein
MSDNDARCPNPCNFVHTSVQKSDNVEALSVIDLRIAGLLAEALAMANYFDRYQSVNAIVLAITAHDMERSTLQES